MSKQMPVLRTKISKLINIKKVVFPLFTRFLLIVIDSTFSAHAYIERDSLVLKSLRVFKAGKAWRHIKVTCALFDRLSRIKWTFPRFRTATRSEDKIFSLNYCNERMHLENKIMKRKPCTICKAIHLKYSRNWMSGSFHKDDSYLVENVREP